jgi:hypothetical protein
MVHALDETWRVLVPQGRLIDLRPYCLEIPLEFVFEQSMIPVARLDSSSSKPDDLAADKAFKSAVDAGFFKLLTSDYFYSAYYWSSVEDMLVDYNDKWKDDVVLPGKVLRRATNLYKKHPACATLDCPPPVPAVLAQAGQAGTGANARLRIRIRAKLVVYTKQG